MSHETLVGRQLGPYRILRLVGRGGFAWVFLAADARLGRQVALKVLFPEHARNPEFVARFSRGARIAAELQHPNIVHVLDVRQQSGYHYIAMAYIDGDSLEARLRRRPRMDMRETIAVLGQIASALDYAHRRGVVHRDVKPSNILLDGSGKAYLTDFGIARAAWETRVTRAGGRIGTPQYMPPEQVEGKGPDARSDLYSLGVVLYEMVCGRFPFRGGNAMAVLHQVVNEAPLPPRRLNRNISPALEAVLLRAIAKEPSRRFQSGAEMVRALVAAARVTPGAAAGQPSGTALRVAGIIGAGALAILLIVWSAGQMRSRPEPTPVPPWGPTPVRESAVVVVDSRSPTPRATATRALASTSTPIRVHRSRTPTRTARVVRPTPTRSRTPRPTATYTRVPPRVATFDYEYHGLNKVSGTWENTGVVQGQVTDASGRAIAGVSIWISVNGSEFGPETTDGTGWYHFYLRPGQRVSFVRIEVPGRQATFASRVKGFAVTTVAEAWHHVDFEEH